MQIEWSRRGWLLSALALPLVGVACDSEVAAKKEATIKRLAGTWLKQAEQDGIRTRRVLVLSPDRSFEETGRISFADGVVREEAHSGEWFFDGTYFKRKYTKINGKQQNSSGITLATLRLEASADDEIVGVDDARKVSIKYQRVSAGTRP